MKYLHHILVSYVGGAYQKAAVNSEWTPLLDWRSVDVVTCLGTETLALDPLDPNKSKAFFESLSLNKI